MRFTCKSTPQSTMEELPTSSAKTLFWDHEIPQNTRRKRIFGCFVLLSIKVPAVCENLGMPFQPQRRDEPSAAEPQPNAKQPQRRDAENAEKRREEEPSAILCGSLRLCANSSQAASNSVYCSAEIRREEELLPTSANLCTVIDQLAGSLRRSCRLQVAGCRLETRRRIRSQRATFNLQPATGSKSSRSRLCRAAFSASLHWKIGFRPVAAPLSQFSVGLCA